ncbi:permease for cytosine/purines, uracil, thiamine, allantoin-domain-containing protein [Cristinia sonorae]|uniref:Permease for cytosine/purines, uracil, thiamine, allantoin-domain-containing protein n=1 Tax=Cristinia sonorae TaxID=1940300 RepID=A0A8K0XRC8_9AGAR|nr:permease for cytosine/purines, uracil, thiamine, allantoin-domain-containing protein [Cristinia sonorae]
MSETKVSTSFKLSGSNEKLAEVVVSEVYDTTHTPQPTKWSEKLELGIQKLTTWLSRWGVETQGIEPIPEEQRTDPRLYQMFLMWFSANMNIVMFGTGAAGPGFFGLGIKSSVLTILVADVITIAFPAFFAVFGPKLGTRAMVQSRFSWGYYGAIIPSILNILTNEGYLIINAILGGQALAGTTSHLSTSVGIVIIGLISLAVTFCGYRVLHWYESLSWIPSMIVFVVMIGVGGKHLVNAPTTNLFPVEASAIMTFGATLAANVLSWASLTPDYGVYHKGDASDLKIFLYVYAGFILAMAPAHMLGAVFAAAASSVPSWEAGLGNGNNVGGLIAAVLQPAGGFGKFLLVVLALTTPSASSPTLYTVCTSFMTVSSVFARIPRFLIAILATAIGIPISIVGATRFYATMVQILSFIGYWSAPWSSIVLVEHFYIRRTRWSSYEPVTSLWNKPNLLPPGYAAILTFVITIGVIVPCMQQEWWTGPVARAGAGDVGMLVGWFVAAGVYAVARSVEKKRWGR